MSIVFHHALSAAVVRFVYELLALEMRGLMIPAEFIPLAHLHSRREDAFQKT